MIGLRSRLQKLESSGKSTGKGGYTEFIVTHPAMSQQELQGRIRAAEERGVPFLVVISHVPEPSALDPAYEAVVKHMVSNVS